MAVRDRDRPLAWGCRLLAGTLLLLLLQATAATPGRAAEEDSTPLDQFFHGKVVAFEKGRLTLRYDFQTADQQDDWTETRPFPVARLADQGVHLKEGRLEVRGNAAARHRAAWTRDVEVRCRLEPTQDHDVGLLLVDEKAQDTFVGFVLGDRFFHHADGKEGGANTILEATPRYRKPGAPPDTIGFRWIARRTPPPGLDPGHEAEFSCALERGKALLHLGDLDLSGRLKGRAPKAFHPTVYALDGTVSVAWIEISGRLDDAWRKENHVSLTLAEPLPPPPGPKPH